MPLYEFRCETCGAREEVFVRSVTSEVKAPACPVCKDKPAMGRAMSKFARHLTEADQIDEAEAKWGKDVDAAMGPSPDVGRYARRFDKLAKDLPPPEELA